MMASAKMGKRKRRSKFERNVISLIMCIFRMEFFLLIAQVSFKNNVWNNTLLYVELLPLDVSLKMYLKWSIYFDVFEYKKCTKVIHFQNKALLIILITHNIRHWLVSTKLNVYNNATFSCNVAFSSKTG